MANYYDSSNLWDDTTGSMSDFQTLDAVLGFGQHMNEAANPIANQTVQNTILGAKNDLDSYEQSLMGMQQAETYEDLVNMRKNFQPLNLGLTSDLGNKHNAGLNILQGALSGAQTGSIGGPWGTLGGAISGAIGTSLAELFGDGESEKQKVYQELKDKETEYNNYAQNFFNMNAQNINNKNYRNMLANMAAFGGYIGGNGGDWSDGLTFVNAGGSHGQNPYGGVPVGIAPDQRPNLVEEGEVIWNDYVFSDRIKVPKDLSEKYKLNDMSFAKAVKKLQKGAEERPNDKIEQDSLNTILSELAQEQEAIRQRRAEKKVMNGLQELADIYAEGGGIHIAKNKRGTFTAAATKHGMGVQEFARKVLANKEDYSPAMVKKANFARNASRWSHGLGGYLFAMGGPEDNVELLPDELEYAFTNGYKPSQLLIDTIKKSERYMPEIYQNEYEENGEMKLDRPTIGYGTTDDDVIKAFEGKKMSEKQAEYYLKKHVDNDIKIIKNKIGKDNWNKLPKHTKEALLDYAYVRGAGNAIDAYTNYNSDIAKHYAAKKPNIAIPNRVQSILDTYTEEAYKGNQETVTTPVVNSKIRRSLLDEPLKPINITKYAFGGPKGHYYPGPGGQAQYLEYINEDPYWWMGDYRGEQEVIPEMGLTTYTGNPYSTPQGGTKQTQPTVVGSTSGNPETSRGLNLNASLLRYAPVLGSAISSLAAALDSPNRSYARNLRNSAKAFSNMMQPISSRPIANYLKYNPLDRMFYTNQLMSSAAANRSAIRENANVNRQAAINNLLAADYNTNVGLGNLFRQAEEYNQAQRERVTGFNRETDRYNSAIALDAAKQNAATRQAKASLLWDAAQKANMLDMQEDQLLQASRNQALTNLFNNLGGVGKEEYIFQMMRDNPDLAYYLTGLGNMRYKKPE